MVTRDKNNRDRAEDGFRDVGKLVARISLWALIGLVTWASATIYSNSIAISIITTQTLGYQENAKAERSRMREAIRRLEDHRHK